MLESTRVRALLLGCAVLAGCGESRPAVAPGPAAGAVKMLDGHRGATALWHDPDGDLWVSVVQDWDRPSPIRLSRGGGPIEHTLTGWVAGVRGGRAYVVVPAGDHLEVEAIGPAGAATVLGTLPPVPLPYGYTFAVTASAEVVAAGGDTGAAGSDVVLVGAGGTRRISSVVLPGDSVWSMAADPLRPRLALTLQQTVGTPDITRSGRLVVLDTASGAVLRDEPLGSLSAGEGEVAFDLSGALWLHHDDRLDRMAEGTRRSFLPGARIDARNLVLAADGSAVAYTEMYGGGDVLPLSGPFCAVHYRRTDAVSASPSAEPVARFEGGCYFGLGLAIVAGTLWIAPP